MAERMAEWTVDKLVGQLAGCLVEQMDGMKAVETVVRKGGGWVDKTVAQLAGEMVGK